MPLKDLPTRSPPDLVSNGRNWEWLKGLRGEQVAFGTPVNATDPADKKYVDDNIVGGTTPTGPAGGALDGNYPNPGLAASVAGNGLTESSDVLAVVVDGSTIEISADSLRVKDGGVTEAKLSFDPATQTELNAEAATRAANDIANLAIAEARANHTGTQLASTVSDFDTQVRTSRLDQMAAPTANLSANSHKITNLSDGTNALDAVNLEQLLAASSAAAAGLSIKATVRVASTANVAPSTTSALVLTGAGTITLDGVLLANGDRILLKDQTAPAQNGIWTYTTGATNFGGTGNFGGVGSFGDPSSGWTLTRATDADEAAEFPGMFVPTGNDGTANKNTAWLLTTAAPITVGTTSLAYVQFSATPTGTAGGDLTGTYPNPTIGTGKVTSTAILDGTIVNADVNASAAIAYSKLATLTSAHVLVGNSSNVATDTAVTGDVTISNAGVTAIGTGKVTSGMIVDGTITLTDISSTAATAGTYTPTLTGVANVAATTAYSCQYMRVGNVVTVSGKMDLDPTASGTQTTVGISLPIASDFANDNELGGTGATNAGTITESFGINADATNNRAQMQAPVATAVNHGVQFTFTYRVI